MRKFIFTLSLILLASTAWGQVVNNPSGGGGTLTPYGTLLNQTNFTSLTGYTNNGTTVTATGGALQFSGGVGSFTQSLDYNYQTQLPIWSMSCYWTIGTITASSYGIGCGLRSDATNGAALRNVLARLDSSNVGGQAGNLFLVNGPSNTTIGNPTGSLTLTAGDHVVITISRYYDIVTATAQDLSTTAAPLTVSYRYFANYNATVLLPNLGKFAVYNFGGTQTVTAINVSSAIPTGADVLCLGDSKTAGYYTGLFSGSWCMQMQNQNIYRAYPITGGDIQTADILLNMPEVLALKPRAIVLQIGGNDLRQSVAVGTVEANIVSILTQAQAAGILTYVDTYPVENSGVSMTTLNTWILAGCSALCTGNALDVNHGFTAGSVPATWLAADGIHPLLTWETYMAQLNEAFLQSKALSQLLPSNPIPVPVPVVSGCSLTSPLSNPLGVGASAAGQFTSGTTGTCTVIITPGNQATTGFFCNANDLTTTADKLIQTTNSTAACTIAGTTASGDVINWVATPY